MKREIDSLIAEHGVLVQTLQILEQHAKNVPHYIDTSITPLESSGI